MGYRPTETPGDEEARSFLESAWRLGGFLRTLSRVERAQATIATKFGEHWDAAARDRRAATAQDHAGGSCAARSWGAPGSTPRGWALRLQGPASSDLESARIAVEDGYGLMQLPYNGKNTRFEAVLDAAASRGMRGRGEPAVRRGSSRRCLWLIRPQGSAWCDPAGRLEPLSLRAQGAGGRVFQTVRKPCGKASWPPL